MGRDGRTGSVVSLTGQLSKVTSSGAAAFPGTAPTATVGQPVEPRRPPRGVRGAHRLRIRKTPGPGRILWWHPVENLPVPATTWRAMLRSTARRTFLIPPTVDEQDGAAGHLVYAMWIDPSLDPDPEVFPPHDHAAWP